MLPYVCFLSWVKFYFIQVFFSFGRLKERLLVKLYMWLPYTVRAVWEFDWADSALTVLDELLSYRGGRLKKYDCSIKCYWTNTIYFSLCFLAVLYQPIFTMGLANWYSWLFCFIVYSVQYLLKFMSSLKKKDRHISDRPSIFNLLDLSGPRPPPLCHRYSVFLFC